MLEICSITTDSISQINAQIKKTIDDHIVDVRNEFINKLKTILKSVYKILKKSGNQLNRRFGGGWKNCWQSNSEKLSMQL